MHSRKGLMVIFFSVIAILVIFVIIKISKETAFEYNEEGVTGNTNGNLYNGGLFCEYGDDVYFSNPYDKNTLYKMNKEGTEFEKVYSDDSSYISIYNDYIYYKKFNDEEHKDQIFSRALYAIVRYSIDDNVATMIHTGMIDCMTLCGNYIYYRYYDNDDFYSLRKVKIDGEEDVEITETDYAPIAVWNEKIYFTDCEGTHNVLALNTQNDTISTVLEANVYMPDIANGSLYYIDLDNDRKLTRYSLQTGEKTVLSEDKVINYNMSSKYGVIFYQAENSADDHRLCRMGINGENIETIATGDYCKIGITEKYTYFYENIMGNECLLRTPTKGSADPKIFYPEVIAE